MTRTIIAVAAAALAIVLVILGLVLVRRALERDLPAAADTGHTGATGEAAASLPMATLAPAAASAADQGFLYGRVTNNAGTIYEGRLRFGGDQEAFWGDYFNGYKDKNPWVTHVPPERLPKERPSIKIFGLELKQRERPKDLGRPYMARIGDIARIEGGLSDVRLILKSGTVIDLDRQSASDFDDGVRVWDANRGVVDVDWIRTIELLPTVRLADAPGRLHGTVRTRQGDFTGFVQWNRKECVGPDELDGRDADDKGGQRSLRFDTICSIARRSSDSSLVTLLDGREVVLSGTQRVGHGNLGVYVDDQRYGRVLVSWDAFERLDFSPAGSGPAYGDFPPGRPLMGSVTTRAGRRLAGRLVYDLDESETTETLDAASQGVDYTIPFGLVASIVLNDNGESGAKPARVTLQSGEEVLLERTGDLGEGNAGILVFADGLPQPEYVAWADVERVDFDRPPAMYPALGGH